MTTWTICLFLAFLALANADSSTGGLFSNLKRRHNVMNQNEVQDLDGDQGDPVVFHTFIPANKKTNCTACVTDRELYLNFTKEEIRKDILRKLGMKEAPNVSMDNAPKHLIRQMMERYQHQYSQDFMNDAPAMRQIEDEDDFFQTRLINILGKNPDQHLPSEITAGRDIQFFDLDIPQLRDDLWRNVERAQLFLHLPAAPSPNDDKAWIDTLFIGQDKHGLPFAKKKRVTKADLLPNTAGWVEIDVKDIVKIWLKDPSTNKGLEFVVKTENGKRINAGIQYQQVDRNIPYLQLEIRDSWIARRKRTLSKVCSRNTDQENNEDEDQEDHCCMWPLTVDFAKDYEWKFIIFPPFFQPNYCSGDCSLGKMMPENTYAHILQQSGISPCCNPQKMGTLDLLYMDESNNVVQGTLPKMMVEKCGCA